MKAALFVGLILARGCATAPAPSNGGPPVLRWKPAIATQPVPSDPDDPAIWVHPARPELSLIAGTNKAAAPNGALVVYDLEGKIVQTISGLDRPNNVDIRQHIEWPDGMVDLAVVTERRRSRLRIYSIDEGKRRFSELTTVPVFAGETHDAAAPMGIALYRRASDSALFVIVGRKSGPLDGYLWQYRIEPGPVLKLVRKFGRFSGRGEIEAIVADDATGYVYYAEEGAGIHKYHADPDRADANTELALFGTSGYKGDREGLAIYTTSAQTGFLVSTDQIPGRSRYLLYRREGAAGNPHDHSQVVATIEGGADETDGIEATSTPLGPAFPYGILVTMNSGRKNFLYFDWKPIVPPGSSPETGRMPLH